MPRRPSQIKTADSELFIAIVNLHRPAHVKALALLRSGLEHNFISRTLVQMLNLPLSLTKHSELEPIGASKIKIYGAYVFLESSSDLS